MLERPHLDFPVRLTTGGRLFVNEQGSDAEVAACIAVIINWPQGTREGDPGFGILDPLFESGGPDLAAIRTAVAANEPRVVNLGDEVLERTLRRGRARVEIDYGQRAEGE